MSPGALERSFVDHVTCTRGRKLEGSTELDRYVALALSIRDRLMKRWTASERAYTDASAKRIFYLSAEFLLGRAMRENLSALDLEVVYRERLGGLGIDLDSLLEQEPEPGLGNGGLGRLAACFLESMATLSLPGFGHGIRYEFGIFEQAVRDGQQVERADEWLRFGNPWEVARPEDAVEIGFFGDTQHVPDGEGFRVVWTPRQTVTGIPHDVPIAGFRNNTVNPLRLWAAKSSREFDFQLFNAGDYVRAVEGKNASEVISKVLYPNDNFEAGRELRLRQEYFFVACSIQDIVRGHLKRYQTLDNFADKVAVQLNDTHPAVAIAELMRLLVDRHGLSWSRAWETTVACFGYTNHTLLPEALERWPAELFSTMLPRHFELIQEIDRRFRREVLTAYPHDRARADRMAIIDHAGDIHMARLAVVGSHAVNGVAALHTELLKTRVMRDFYELYPKRFSNKTNGVTPRRWLLSCNPQLSELITSRIGKGWVKDLERLRELEPHIESGDFLSQIKSIKLHHKRFLAGVIRQTINVQVDETSMFDVQIKRLHEYKRQLLNLLHIVSLYLRNKRGDDLPARTFIFGAKAAPGYRRAKEIIRLIHDVAEVINADPATPQIKIVFLPNYRVTLAEKIIPAADLSEQISTAGKEASGTGNMKLSMNGALTVGTLDGANIEIRDAVGKENFFLFGRTEAEVVEYGKAHPDGRHAYEGDDNLREVVDLIADGFFSPDEPGRYAPMMRSLIDYDEFLVFADFEAYRACQSAIGDTYLQGDEWARRAAFNIARIGMFSSDRTIAQYANEIWNVPPVPVVSL